MPKGTSSVAVTFDREAQLFIIYVWSFEQEKWIETSRFTVENQSILLLTPVEISELQQSFDADATISDLDEATVFPYEYIKVLKVKGKPYEGATCNNGDDFWTDNDSILNKTLGYIFNIGVK